MVLIVDDDRDFSAALADSLTDFGFSVEAAFDGRVALERLTDTSRPSPMVIVLDLYMPKMTGLEFLAARKGSPHVAAVPVIVLSGNPEMSRDVFSLGADVVFPKPVNLFRLVDAIRQMIAAHADVSAMTRDSDAGSARS